ncbi:MAG: TAXI family TRAP transporter solute-binding subunit [Vicinamibacteria bacterium]
MRRAPVAGLACAAAVCLALVPACAPKPQPGGVRRLSIAAGLLGGVYSVYGAAIARVVGAAIPGVELTAETTSGSVDNLKLLRDGKADLAFALADSLRDALDGRAPFEDGPVKAAALAVLYTNHTHVVALEGGGVASLGDLRGKQVSLGAPGSGTETIATRLLMASGLDPERDLNRQALGVGPAVDALKDGKLDAFFWSGGVPTAALLELAATPGRKLLLVPNAGALGVLRGRYGMLYFPATIPAAAYPGLAQDVPVVGVSNVLVVREDLDPELAYQITKALFEGKQALVAAHPEAEHLTLPQAADASPAPFHPGAQRYFRERGAWPR